jgi:copper chaperone CopZ
MFKQLLISTALVFATPVLAQEAEPVKHDMKDHGAHKSADHDMTGHDMADHDMSEHDISDHGDHEHDKKAAAPAVEGAANMAFIADTPEIKAALAAGGEPVVVDVLGVVCDFCAKAMNKTFGKRDEVSAVFVDLDTKALSLVVKLGATLNNETITDLVKKAGYKTAGIRRGDAALKG